MMYQQEHPKRETFEEQRFKSLLNEGIAAVKGGNRQQAKRLLVQATQIRAADASPWLWLSATTDDPEEQRIYLERAVAAEPSNAAARRGLVMLSDKLDRDRLMEEGASIQPRQAVEPEEAQAEAHICPKCGGNMVFDIHKSELTCQYCGAIQVTEQRLVADAAEQVMDFVMPTTRAHRWAEAQQRVACEHCGAISILPPGQTADRCPYCGSNRFVTSHETMELVDPQVIALMKLGEQEVNRRVKAWFGKGLFAPDDLTSSARGIKLYPAYYPFWTFDGTLEIPWSCEVNEGTNKNPRWVQRSDSEFKFFDDILVPGIRAMPSSEVADIEPFDLKDLVEFSPEYLAGWNALTYDYPLADASLRAREKVIQQVRRTLYANIEPGHQKRNINTGAGKWSGLTFKHVLLPLWVGTYRYRGKEYRLLVNGQTGKVGGRKPRDTLKTIMITVGGGLILIIIAAILILLWMNSGGMPPGQ